MSVLKKIIIILLILTILIISLVYDSLYVAPSRFQVRYETLSDVKIPEQLNDLNIIYFSDLHYGTNMCGERLQKLIELINNCAPDIVLFGGDLISDQQYDQSQIDELTSSLAAIEARLGKFAVLGEYDHQQLDLVNQILVDSDFEILSTPGHTPGGVCYYFREYNALFTGDTLFRASIGRTDLPGGDTDVLLESVSGTLMQLPDSLEIYPGHGFPSTIGWERRNNPYICKS